MAIVNCLVTNIVQNIFLRSTEEKQQRFLHEPSFLKAS